MIKLKTYIDSVDDFLLKMQSILDSNEVDFKISLVDYVKFNGTKCNGFFNDIQTGYGRPTLAISVGKPIEKWLPTLIHEFCHFRQWRVKDPLWMDLRKNNVQDEDFLFDWVNGTEFPDGYISDLIPKVRNMELDCEKRVIEFIKNGHLPIDIVDYVRNANAYINFYTYMGMKRKWYVIGKEPYNNPEITRLMSVNFDMDYENLSPELIALYDDCVVE